MVSMVSFAAQIQYGQIQQILKDKVKHVYDSARSSIAVIKWVDALKLEMDNGHLDQGVQTTKFIVIYILFKIVH